MGPKLKKVVLSAAAVITVAVTVTVVGTAHAADPTVHNEKSQDLTNLPQDHMASSVVERRIYLAAGNYRWFRHFHRYPQCADLTIYLGAGWYTWKDTLDPKNSFYRESSSLNPDNPSWNTRVTNCDIDIRRQGFAAGKYTWGSGLDPLF